MNNREIRDALASAFLEVELTVRVKHARSTNSVYLTVSNSHGSLVYGHGSLAYVIRISDHPSSRRFSKIDDFWIDTSRKNVVPMMNEAIKGAAHRLGVVVQEVVPEEKQRVEEKSEECVQTSDYSNQLVPEVSQSMINLEQYYLTSQGFVSEIDNNPEVKKWNGHLEKEWDDSDPFGTVKFAFGLAFILLAVYCLI